MAKFVTTESFWDLFPAAKIGVVTAKGISNDIDDETAAKIKADLEESFPKAKEFLTADVFSENSVIAVWREAFRKFKTKKGVRSSIEAMLKRVDKDNPVGSINPIVDIYNAASLTYALPVGGEDIDHFAGDLLLTVADGGEDFLALGDEEPQPALPGEVIYKDDLGAVCRCWNWRDGQRTMLTDDTKNAFLIIECVDPSREVDLNVALERLAEKTAEYLGAETKISIVDADNKEIEI